MNKLNPLDILSWDSCDEHETSFLKDSYCDDCHIAELEAQLAELFEINNRNVKLFLKAEAQLEKVRGLPEKWRHEADYLQDENILACADELQAILEKDDG